MMTLQFMNYEFKNCMRGRHLYVYCLLGYILCCIKAQCLGIFEAPSSSAACIRVGFQIKSSSIFFREMLSNPQETVEPESINKICTICIFHA